jgi:hypothetical protein
MLLLMLAKIFPKHEGIAPLFLRPLVPLGLLSLILFLDLRVFGVHTGNTPFNSINIIKSARLLAAFPLRDSNR